MPALAEADAITAARALLARGPHWVIALASAATPVSWSPWRSVAKLALDLAAAAGGRGRHR
jgi:hypothetical protein